MPYEVGILNRHGGRVTLVIKDPEYSQEHAKTWAKIH